MAVYVAQLGGTEWVQQEYLTMLNASEVQKHLRDCLLHGLCKQLHKFMYYLYDAMRIMYPQLVTAAHKAESEQEDSHVEGVQARWAQSEGKDGIVSLRDNILLAASGSAGATENCNW